MNLLPAASAGDIGAAVPGIGDVREPLRGGQRLVFPCTFGESAIALSVLKIDLPAELPWPDDASLGFGESVKGRAERELELLANCNTPHLVRPVEPVLTDAIVRGEAVIYFGEEWVEGRSVRDLLASYTVLEVQEVVRLATEVCMAIEQLWSLRAVHRDIKPDNVIRRTDSGAYVLLDLGVALDLSASSLTVFSGVVPGTYSYYSPEQADVTKKRTLDFRSDLFALGLVLYDALAGRHAFRRSGMDRDTTIRAICCETPQPVSQFRPDVPPALEAVVMRLLRKSPHQRYNSCSSLVRELQAI